MCYTHLTRSQRYQIEVLKQADVPVDRIAHKLGVHRSTIYRELNRGGRKRQDYVAWYAQETAERRIRRSAAMLESGQLARPFKSKRYTIAVEDRAYWLILSPLATGRQDIDTFVAWLKDQAAKTTAVRQV